MAFDSVPWFIGGGAEHSPAVARMLAYAATNGATGIISPGDLKVTALPTPGPAVRIAPGGAVMLNRYPGAPNQSYTVRNATETYFDVTATGSSGGATKYLILRVDDPEFDGQAPADRKNGPYVRPVWVNSITNLAYPFVLLSKLVQPANTATITNAMLTDPREVANPRAPERTMRVNPVSTAKDLTSTSWVDFPGVTEEIPVPPWATYAVITAQMGGMQQVGGAVASEFSLNANNVVGQFTAVDNPAPSSGYARVPAVFLKWENPVSDLAGGTLSVKLRGRKLSGAGYLRADNYTQLVYDVQFTQGSV